MKKVIIIKPALSGTHNDAELEQGISCALRVGYASRNPLFNENVRYRKDTVLDSKLPRDRGRRTSAHGFALIGVSGVGKSTSLHKILLSYEPVD